MIIEGTYVRTYAPGKPTTYERDLRTDRPHVERVSERSEEKSEEVVLYLVYGTAFPYAKSLARWLAVIACSTLARSLAAKILVDWQPDQSFYLLLSLPLPY